MKKKLAFTIVLATLLLQLCVCPFVSAGAPDPAAKLDQTLSDILASASEQESIPVLLWLKDIPHEEIEAAAATYSGNLITQAVALEENAPTANALPFLHTPTTDSAERIHIEEETAREITQASIAYKRSLHTAAYESANTEAYEAIFPAEQTRWFRTIPNEQPEIVYISRYTPTILANMTAQQIEQACQSDQVIAIYYESPAVAPDEETNLQPASGTTATADSITEAFRVRDEKGLDGTGIKIGMIESGVPANDTEHFTVSNLFYDPIVCSEPNTVKTQYITPHASTVAYIMVGKSGGIVPNATLYCTTVNARSGGWWEGIEWLMDRGINIINISHSLADRQESRYNEHARWLDHVAIQHSVHIVIATGKTGSSTYMGPGAFGHNVISVGGTDADGTLGTYSNYSMLYHKPDLCAPGTITSPYMSSYGTSFAAPQVSAVLAQLCQRDPAVFTHQDMAKSILLASTVVTGIVSEPGSDSHTASQPGTGAGILNAWNAYYVLNNGRCRGTSFAANAGIDATYTKTFSVSSKDSFIRVSLAWLADARISVADHTIADAEVTTEKLTLTVTAPNGTVWTSSAALSDMQLIAFVPNQTGVYTITVTRTSDLGTKIYFGISWY